MSVNQTNRRHPVTGEKIKMWSKEEIAQLWSGDAEYVAKLLGRTPGAVNVQRRTFLKKNKNFTIPSVAKYKPRQRKLRTSRPWSKEDIDMLFSGTPKQVARKLGRTEKAVNVRRSKHMVENPNFVPPIAPRKSRASRKNADESAGPVSRTSSSAGFTMKVGNKIIELPKTPSKIKIDDFEIEF